MSVFFTSDLHFGHKNVIRFDNRPYTTVEEMDADLIARWNAKVGKGDTVYILGDFSWYGTDKTRDILNSLNGKKFLIRGNHDRTHGLEKYFEDICDYKELRLQDGNMITLCHYPIPFFNRHHYGAYMLYGHVHNSQEWNMTESYRRALQELDIPCEMYNVGCMVRNYEPVTLAEILAQGAYSKETQERK